MTDVARWLRELGLEKYVDAFSANEIDFRALPELTEDDLKELGLPIGPRRIVMKALVSLRPAPEGAGIVTPKAHQSQTFAPARGAASPPPLAERRQITIMFCDMVGSSALSTRLDPEEQREVISTFQGCCAKEVKRLGGMVAQYLGDGVLAYFGYPAAHEDDAERAVRAGLAILDVVDNLKVPAGATVQARIGTASGVVVVGDLVREGVTQENAAIGETTNLAARLQSLAEPNTLLICAETHRLVGVMFEYRDLGAHALKGFAKPIHVRQVIGGSKVENRFEARRAEVTSPLLGRDEELELLLRRWEQAKRGEGRVVVLSGEAGIGKSRLTRALHSRLTEERPTFLMFHCSPYHQESALYPVIGQLLRAAAIERDDPTHVKFTKLEALLGQSSDDLAEDLPLFAALLSISTGDRYPLPKLAPQRLKELTLRALINHLKRLAEKQPVLILFEDLHWVDPTSLDLLSLMVEEAPGLRVLFIATVRPDFAPRWPSHPHISTISLNRLGRTEGRALVEDVTKGKALPPEVLEQILARTDGVPLFIEELTKTVLETGLLRDAGGHYVLTAPLPPLAIPSTLRASLIARLDRLASVKDVAQIGATIGREFSYRLVSAVSELPEDRLRDALSQLAGAELIFQRGTPPDATYLFKHGLVQDAAYASLVRSRRQQLHALVGHALEEQFSEIAETEPEIVAHHYAEAKMVALAIRFWKKAGNRALERSANSEAIDHFKRVLAVVTELDDEKIRLEDQFEGHHGLGKGTFAAGHLLEAMSIFDMALTLARTTGSAQNVALAALSFDQAQFLTGQVPEKSMEVLREAMDGLLETDGNLRCQILSRLGRAHRMSGDAATAAKMDREAMQLARELHDDRALFDAFTGSFLSPMIMGKNEIEERGEQVHEFIELAHKVNDPDYLGRALSVDIYFAAEVADRRRLDRAIRVYKEFSETNRALAHQWVVRNGEAMRAILDGNFEQAEALSEAGRLLGEATQSESVDGVFGMQMFSIRREQGRLAEVAPIIKRFIEEDTNQAEWRPGFAVIASDLGFSDAAKRRLADYAEQGFYIPLDAKRSTSLSYLAEVAVAVQDLSSARRLYELLLEYRYMTITTGLVTVCYGSASRYLGMLAAVLGDHEAAVDHFEHALSMNTTLGARPWLAHTQFEYARVLRGRGDHASVRRAEALTSEASAIAAKLGMVRLQQRLQTIVH
jgi:class 3 adenylate cyclase/tetratricopeptide (TPR) repeat protein